MGEAYSMAWWAAIGRPWCWMVAIAVSICHTRCPSEQTTWMGRQGCAVG